MSVVYLIIDTRPEVIAAGYSNGIPFHCGSSIESMEVAERRMLRYMKNHPSLAVSQRLAHTEGYYTIRTIAVTDGRLARYAMVARMRAWIDKEFGGVPQVSKSRRPRCERSPWERKIIGEGVRKRIGRQTTVK